MRESDQIARGRTGLSMRRRAVLRVDEREVFGSLDRLDELDVVGRDHVACGHGRDAEHEQDPEDSQRRGEPARGSMSSASRHWNHYVTHTRRAKRRQRLGVFRSFDDFFTQRASSPAR